VLLKLADCANDDGAGVWPALDRVAAQCGCSKRHVRNVLRRHEAAGLLVAEAGPYQWEFRGRKMPTTLYRIDAEAVRRGNAVPPVADDERGNVVPPVADDERGNAVPPVADAGRGNATTREGEPCAPKPSRTVNKPPLPPLAGAAPPPTDAKASAGAAAGGVEGAAADEAAGDGEGCGGSTWPPSAAQAAAWQAVSTRLRGEHGTDAWRGMIKPLELAADRMGVPLLLAPSETAAGWVRRRFGNRIVQLWPPELGAPPRLAVKPQEAKAGRQRRGAR